MAVSTYASTLTFAWDRKPADQNWTRVRLYEKSGATYNLLVEVDGTATQATATNVAPGAHTFVARFFDGTWESGDSNVVVTGPVPNPPGEFQNSVSRPCFCRNTCRDTACEFSKEIASCGPRKREGRKGLPGPRDYSMNRFLFVSMSRVPAPHFGGMAPSLAQPLPPDTSLLDIFTL
jgi:hypothetical protein